MKGRTLVDESLCGLFREESPSVVLEDSFFILTLSFGADWLVSLSAIVVSFVRSHGPPQTEPSKCFKSALMMDS